MTDLCMMCGKTEPTDGWYCVGCNDGDAEFFCSQQCFNDSCDYHDDSDIDPCDDAEFGMRP